MKRIRAVTVDEKIKIYSKKLRRDFHQFPELGFNEVRTSRIVAAELRKFGYLVKENVAKTGVVGILPGKPGTPVIMLRFDMDALPIQEENSFKFKSDYDGIMHACGHDAHLAIGLSIAKIISSDPKFRQATIKIVFQPAEEGLGGAKEMIEEGVLKDPKPDYCFGLHVWNEKPVGWIGINPGSLMAGADTFVIRIIGKGGHGGLPHETIDPIIAAANLIQSVQTIVSRNLSPLESGVVSFGSIHGGSAANVIPEVVTITGTIRTFNRDIRQNIFNRIEEIINGVSLVTNCKISFENSLIAPPLINSAKIVEEISKNTIEKFENIMLDDSFKTMASEDFAFYSEEIPSCFILFGASNVTNGQAYGHHHPKFDIDESVLSFSIEVMLEAIFDIVQNMKTFDRQR